MIILHVDVILSDLQNADTSDCIVIAIDMDLEMLPLAIIATASIPIAGQVDVSTINCLYTHQTCHVA